MKQVNWKRISVGVIGEIWEIARKVRESGLLCSGVCHNCAAIDIFFFFQKKNFVMMLFGCYRSAHVLRLCYVKWIAVSLSKWEMRMFKLLLHLPTCISDAQNAVQIKCQAVNVRLSRATQTSQERGKRKGTVLWKLMHCALIRNLSIIFPSKIKLHVALKAETRG